MPTFEDPAADGDEARRALRGLAHATGAFENPADTYAVIGDLLSTVGSLRQVLDQLATAHLPHRTLARDDNGDAIAGARTAVSAADQLRQAAALVDQLHSGLDSASQLSGRIAWDAAPSSTYESRWISVVFLQGEDADKVLGIIDSAGIGAAIENLAGYDYGDETTQAALVNGYVYKTAPVGALDRTVTDRTVTGGTYTLTYSPSLGHVSLLRKHTVPLDPELYRVDTAVRTPARVGHHSPRTTAQPALTDSAALEWFGHARGAATSSWQGLSL